jgi:hypothetical protein
VPYKNATVKRLNLPVNQVSLLKFDLHYSHKTPAVLQLLKEKNIVVVFMPARCTDEMQECDTVITKPFKSGIKAAFRDFPHNDFNSFKGDKELWSIKQSMGKLKPRIVTMVEIGMNVIRYETYASVIQNAFETHGMFKEIRGQCVSYGCHRLSRMYLPRKKRMTKFSL